MIFKSAATFLVGILIGFIQGVLTTLPFGATQLENTASDGILFSSDKRELCQNKYILLTTQKSGSTWFCSVLHQQTEISCGGSLDEKFKLPKPELLIKYSKITARGGIANVTWQQYQKDLDKAFVEACEYNPAMSIGFKIMYDQIPPQFIKDKRLQTYFEVNGVSLIHLVREAAIMKMASAHDVLERGFHHATNSSALQETSSFKWDEAVIDQMLEIEKISLEWQGEIHKMTPLVSTYYISYENLLGEKKRKQLVAQTVSFISGNFDPDIKVAGGLLVKQSSSSCPNRIANYAEFRDHKKVINSRSAVACDLIDSVI